MKTFNMISWFLFLPSAIFIENLANKFRIQTHNSYVSFNRISNKAQIDISAFKKQPRRTTGKVISESGLEK